jgi:DNA-binding CsgD family transcriptional regulator
MRKEPEMPNLPGSGDLESAAGAPIPLVGRAEEQAIIDDLLTGIRNGASRSLVVRGEPGIGKTALLDYAASAGSPSTRPHLSPVQVLRCSAIESEAQMPFGGLHILLRPWMDRLGALPERQQTALAAALGFAPSTTGDRFLVGLAVLSLLAELTDNGPVMCLIDDAHWLDRPSLDALVFAARRSDSDGIALLFATRDSQPPTVDGLPDLPIKELDEFSAARLLDSSSGGPPIEARIRNRLLAAARGNPLALIELTAAYRDRGAEPLPTTAGLTLTDRLQKTFLSQVGTLPAPTQTLLLVAAADDSGDCSVVLAAAAALGATASALEPAELAGLVAVSDGSLCFRHPLLRSAIYRSAPLRRRYEMHRALAEVLTTPPNRDRRAWHLAIAATSPNEAVAMELDHSAGQAAARSGYSAAAAAYERAAELSGTPSALARRLTAAAAASAEAGDFELARSLAGRAMQSTTDPIAGTSTPALGCTVVTRLAEVMAHVDFAQGRLVPAHRALVKGSATICDLDPLWAARMLMTAVRVAWFIGDTDLIATTADRLRALDRSATASLVPLVELVQCAVTQASDRPAEPRIPLAELVRTAQSRTGHRDDLAMITIVSLVTGLNQSAYESAADLVADARQCGSIGWLPPMLNCLAQALVFAGRHGDARDAATEALRLAHDTDQVHWACEATAILAYLAAVEGNQSTCRALAHTTLTGPTSHPATATTPWLDRALGLLALGLGHPDTALIHLDRAAHGPARHHGSALRSIPDLVEAAARVGQLERAAAPLARITAWARSADTPGTDALVERCRALMSTGAAADEHYRAALQPQEESFEQARTRLLYGAWLRRGLHKKAAITQLRAAHEYLDLIGATPWADTAQNELAAAGATTPPPSNRPDPTTLTPQEAQVVRLAGQGLSNREIAAQLFLSPRTVGYHLYKAYPKIGITSRNQLTPDSGHSFAATRASRLAR